MVTKNDIGVEYSENCHGDTKFCSRMLSQQDLNEDIKDILLENDENGTLNGRVCVLCDRFVAPNLHSTLTLKTLVKHSRFLRAESNIPDKPLKACYRFETNIQSVNEALEGCLLSPRAQVIYDDKSTRKRKDPKIICCKECKGGYTDTILRDKLPRFAIANDLTIGTAPECLTWLNEIELALISQARFRGHLFTYWGGCHRSIKGWHSLYEVDVEHTTAVLDNVSKFTQAANIGVVLCGPFTPDQKEKVLQKIQVNVEWILEAFEWLRNNNRLYADMVLPNIGAPSVIDNTEKVQSENSDIESREELKVVFPDCTIRTGGCDDGQQFDEAEVYRAVVMFNFEKSVSVAHTII
eukprot:scaffold27210_cov31-Attheya_sp.AAC.3